MAVAEAEATIREAVVGTAAVDMEVDRLAVAIKGAEAMAEATMVVATEVATEAATETARTVEGLMEVATEAMAMAEAAVAAEGTSSAFEHAMLKPSKDFNFRRRVFSA